MSAATRRAEGAVEELGGKIQRAVGKMIGNKQMEAEGNAHVLEGEAKQEAAKTAERAKGIGEQAIGSIKGHVGSAIGNEGLHAKGRAEELKGEARQRTNN
jgi:uncharacterized protein YjbJ (UPF0337 family)